MSAKDWRAAFEAVMGYTDKSQIVLLAWSKEATKFSEWATIHHETNRHVRIRDPLEDGVEDLARTSYRRMKETAKRIDQWRVCGEYADSESDFIYVVRQAIGVAQTKAELAEVLKLLLGYDYKWRCAEYDRLLQIVEDKIAS